jgi:hypothetical protein
MYLQLERTAAEEDNSAVKCSLMERDMRTKNPWCENRKLSSKALSPSPNL